MCENVAIGASSGDPLKSVADALETAVQAAMDGATDAKATVEQALPAVSRFIYTTCYTFSYGVVFPTVLIARSIPPDNAIINGFVDGARAASDMVNQLKSRQITSATFEPSSSLPL